MTSVKTSALILALCAALGAQPAHACSFSWNKGYSPKEIPHRADVWKVKGDFTLIDAKTGDVPQGDEINLTEDGRELLGRITRKGHKPIETRQYFYEEWMIDCGMGLTPQQPTSGTFWLKRQRDKSGRYRLMMWRPSEEKPGPLNSESAPIQNDGKQ